ncbi:MAG: uncharacterized small protein (DUF1192 family) [Alphaproteobacteria bacterium]|jgi:uncharacterized small protein (DUF1192 family)
MSFDEEAEPQHPANRKKFEPINIDALSVAEMREYIEHAKNEIQRAEAEIKSRESLRGDADSLFKK